MVRKLSIQNIYTKESKNNW